MANEVPLKEMLSALDQNNKTFYKKLDEDQKKAFSPWLAMRYSSSVSGKFDDHYLIMTHEIVNKDFSSLSKHPDLQWKLLSLCGVGQNQYHNFIPPGKKQGKNKIQTFLYTLYPNLKSDELELLENLNTVDELKELARDYGYDDNYIKETFKK